MIKALTLTQPWAGLVAASIKLVENRPRQMIKRGDFGEPFAIHASREIKESVYPRIREIAPELTLDKRLTEEPLPWWYRLSRVTSSVIAIASIADVIKIDGMHEDAIATELERADMDPESQLRWTFGPVVYLLRDVHTLPEPVPCRGWQGFWTLPPEAEDLVRSQIAVTAS